MKMNDILIQSTFRRFVGKMILNNLVMFLGSIVSSVAISRWLGTEAMASFQVTMPLFFAVMMFSQIISMGVQNNCARSIGAGRAEEAGRYYTIAVLGGLPLGLALTAGIFLYAEPLALFLSAGDPEGTLAQGAADYLRGLSPGLSILLLLPMQVSVMFLEGRAGTVLKSVYVQTAAIFIGTAANIFWLGGGLLGMGLVNSFGNASALVLMLAAARRGSGFIKISPQELRPRYLLPILRVGLPSAVDRFYKSVQMFVVNRVLLLVAPSAAIAAFADINSLNNVFNPIVMGLSAATMTMAGVFAGEADEQSLRRLLRVALKNVLQITVLTAAVSFAAAPLLISLFVSEEDPAFGVAVRALSIYVWYLPIYAVNNALQKYYLSVNAMFMTYLTSALDNLIFICLLAMALGHVFGAEGVWFAFILAEILTLLTLVAVISLRLKRLPRSLDDFLCLPQSIAVREPSFSRSASGLNEILEISEAARRFMLSEGAAEREAALMALAIEEMGVNIIRWGFNDGKKHSIDVLLVRDAAWKLRIRDDCAPFDPKAWLDIHRDADPQKNIGIRTICGLAEDVRYVSTLGMNYLFISM